MAYLGQVDRKASNVQVFNVTSSTSATHSIGWTPPSEQTLIVTINGVKQHTNAYSFSGATLTLGAALVATDELEVIGINDIGNSLTPVDGSVSTSKLGDDSVSTAKVQDNAVTLAKMADGTQGDTLYYGAAGAPTLLAKPGTPADEVLTFATGATAPTWVAASSAANVPAFSVYVAAGWDLADATWTLVPFDTADINDDGASGTCFNITASGTNQRGFTVPTGEAGRYQFNYLTGNYSISGDLELQQTVIYKGVSGGAAAAYACQNYWSFWINNGAYTLSGSTILDLAVGDHLYVYTYNAVGGTGGRIAGGRERSIFSGMKLT